MAVHTSCLQMTNPSIPITIKKYHVNFLTLSRGMQQSVYEWVLVLFLTHK